jgi:hypothetical protein
MDATLSQILDNLMQAHQEIARLRAENAQLQARLQAQEPPPQPPPE